MMSKLIAILEMRDQAVAIEKIELLNHTYQDIKEFIDESENEMFGIGYSCSVYHVENSDEVYQKLTGMQEHEVYDWMDENESNELDLSQFDLMNDNEFEEISLDEFDN